MPDLVAETTLEAWGVPPAAFDTLLDGDGPEQIREIQASMRAVVPEWWCRPRQWMTQPNSNPLFEGKPPLAKILQPGGLAEFHNLVVRQPYSL